MLRPLDYLIVAAPDFRVGVDAMERLLGVRLLPGGRHPDWGTRNAIMPLGSRMYLEVIGPDPERGPDAPLPTLFGLNTLQAPRLQTWAARATDLDDVATAARSKGLDLGAVRAGSRERPDGTIARWRLTDPFATRAGGIVPFFIDWLDTPHPGGLEPGPVALVSLSATHPEPELIQRHLDILDVRLDVTSGVEGALVARVRTPRGVVSIA